MAKLQPISNITFSQNLLQPWGKTWLDTVSSTVGKAKNANCFDRKQAMDFGKALDPIVGDAIAQMLGGIPVKAPLSQNALLPPVADCVEVGDTRIIGGVRPQNFDMAYRPDGVRIAYDSKTLNDAKSIKKNWQNMINDIAAEATTLHTRFRYALALFLVVIPEQALNDSQAEGIIHTLERMNERFGVDEENHKAESIALVVWDAVTGRISNTIPDINSSLRIEKYAQRIEEVYTSRYRGLPPHN